MSTFNLPEGLIYEILLRLPVKSVLRFKSVCRAWYVLIKTPLFIRNHLNHVNSDRAFSSIIAFTRANQLLRLYFSESLNNPVNIPLPVICNFDRYQVLGICDGLVCLLVRDYSFVVIFNPMIDEFRIIPSFKTPVRHQDRVFWGFRSFDSSYELTRIVCSSLPNPNMGVSVRAEVYTLLTNSWREINVNMVTLVHLTIYCFGVNPILLRGKYYWGCSDSTRDRVVCFDISREMFCEIIPPPSLMRDDWKVHNWKEELALAIYHARREFSMWVYSENETKWTKSLTINQFPEYFLEDLSYEITVMGCGRNGELILKCDHWEKDELLLYDPVSKEMKLLPYVDAAGNDELYIYTSSLVSPYQR